MPPTARLGPRDALVVVDVQNDFVPGGALPIAEGDRVIPVLNRWIAAAEEGGAVVVVSRDWHPPGHCSFRERGGEWPAHCVQGADGARLHPGLHVPAGILFVSKGTDLDRDQYSDFEPIDLAGLLRALGVKSVWVGGLALDVCVRATVLDALAAGFETHLLLEATRPVDEENGRRAVAEMRAAGAIVEDSG